MRQPQTKNFFSQNPANTDYYQPTQKQNEKPLPYYLQQHEITKDQQTNFSQMLNAAESLQMTMNPYLMGRSSITSNKPLMVFTGTDPEYSVEDYLNAVTANLVLNIGPEPINTPLHQNWIHRHTALIQTLLDGAAQKWFSILPIDIKTNWKRLTREFSKVFGSERNKQHQRVLCNWCNYCRRYGHSIAECRQKQRDNQNKPQKYKEPNKSFYQYMKKDQNLPNKNIHSNNSSGKPLPNNSNYSRNQSPYNSNYRGRSPEQRNSRNFSQNRYSRSNSQNNQYRNNYSRSNSNRTEFFDTSSHSISWNRHYSNDRLRNSSYNRNRNYSNNRIRSYSNNRNQRYQNNRSRNNSYKRSNYQGKNNNYYNRSRNNSQNRNPNYNNRRNYSQSPYRNNNRYPDSQHEYRSNTPKRQRQINQVEATEETLQIPLVLTTQRVPNYS